MKLVRLLLVTSIGAAAGLWISLGVLGVTAANSYLEKVDLNKYSSEQVSEVLNFLDKTSGTEVVLRSKKGIRAISITEVSDEQMADIAEATPGSLVIGLAEPSLDRCDVYILEGLTRSEFFDTLMHELVHCFNFNHVDSPNDLMSSYTEGKITESSKVWWAKLIGRISQSLRF